MRRTTLLVVLAGTLLASTRVWGETGRNPRVDEAIQKGVDYLWSKQKPAGDWGPFGKVGEGNGHLTGPTALVVLSLLESGVSPQEPRMAKALDWLAAQKEDRTYSLGIRANVWQTANKYTDYKYAKNLDRDVRQLVLSSPTGAISYAATGKPHTGGFDHSNCQYHLLGVWAGIMGDSEEVNAAYIKRVMGHWMKYQQRDGGWSYQAAGNSTPTMTAAGLASMFVCFDYLSTVSAEFTRCNRGTGQLKSIAKGMERLEEQFPKAASSHGYYMYGIERVALASGYKYFGKTDWYKLGSQKILGAQQGDGGWGAEHGNREVGTAFCLLFLIRGRNAVLFNKLEYEGDWSNRPRDLSNLTRWMTVRIFDNITVNWQIINLKTPVSEWHDAPFLYISGSIAPKIEGEQLEKIKEFVNQGGTVFSVTECGGQGFKKAITEMTQKLFPDYKLENVPTNHQVYTKATHFDIQGGRTRLQMLSNGSRPLWIHTDVDLPLFWQTNKVASQRWAFEQMVNLTRYVTDSPKKLRHRGTTHWPTPAGQTSSAIKVARLEYKGNWNPEPLALTRLGILVANQDKLKVDVVTTPIAKLGEAGVKVAFLTGTTAWKPDAQELAALKAFAQGGGKLVIDACGGSRDFSQSAITWIEDAFGMRSLRPLAASAELYKGVDKVEYRPKTKAKLASMKFANLQAVLINDKPAVIFSAEDLTTGLLGTQSFTVDGYEGDTAYALVRNILLQSK